MSTGEIASERQPLLVTGNAGELPAEIALKVERREALSLYYAWKTALRIALIGVIGIGVLVYLGLRFRFELGWVLVSVLGAFWGLLNLMSYKRVELDNEALTLVRHLSLGRPRRVELHSLGRFETSVFSVIPAMPYAVARASTAQEPDRVFGLRPRKSIRISVLYGTSRDSRALTWQEFNAIVESYRGPAVLATFQRQDRAE